MYYTVAVLSQWEYCLALASFCPLWYPFLTVIDMSQDGGLDAVNSLEYTDVRCEQHVCLQYNSRMVQGTCIEYSVRARRMRSSRLRRYF